jgi:hypothetical protein
MKANARGRIVVIRYVKRIVFRVMVAVFVMFAVIVSNSALVSPAYARQLATRTQASVSVCGPLLFYRASDGLGGTGTVDTDGRFTNLQSIPGFTRGWTHITYAGGDRLLFYRASDGLGATGTVGTDGRFTNLQSIPGFTQGWTHITYAGGDRLLFYRASDGLGGTGTVGTDGRFTNLQSVPGFNQNWTHIVGPLD